MMSCPCRGARGGGKQKGRKEHHNEGLSRIKGKDGAEPKGRIKRDNRKEGQKNKKCCSVPVADQRGKRKEHNNETLGQTQRKDMGRNPKENIKYMLQKLWKLLIMLKKCRKLLVVNL